MTLLQKGITRRHALAATGAGVLAAGLGVRGASAALETVRQGYQTNMWGMPTYYLLRSGFSKSTASSSRNSPCRRATSPCSRWWRARSTWALMPAPRLPSATTKAAWSPSP